jgi:hypothetical protein
MHKPLSVALLAFLSACSVCRSDDLNWLNGGQYDVHTRQVGDWQLIMLTRKGQSPRTIVSKYLHKGNSLHIAEGRSLISVLNEAYGDKAKWPTFDEQYARELLSILSVEEPQNFGVKLIRSLDDVEGVDHRFLAPDLPRMVVPPAKYEDSGHRHYHLAYFFNPNGGRIIRMVILFSGETDLPAEYTTWTLAERVGKYYVPY